MKAATSIVEMTGKLVVVIERPLSKNFVYEGLCRHNFQSQITQAGTVRSKNRTRQETHPEKEMRDYTDRL